MSWKSVAALSLVTFAMHFAWEMFHGRFYTEMTAMPFWSATRWCLRAAAVDLFISAAIYAFVALLLRDPRWPEVRFTAGLSKFLPLAVGTTIAIELWALGNSRWSYVPTMPALFGIGLLPLLQWTIIPSFTISLVRWSLRRNQANRESASS